LSREQAVIDAGMVRLRPILMTTLTTASGMFPLALGIGEGSELMQPLAVAVVGGLAVSMLLTLFVVPSAYMILNTNAERLMAWLTGAQPARTSEVGTSAPADAVPLGVPEVAGAD
jgi:Cu/Ag efflux pump CusA